MRLLLLIFALTIAPAGLAAGADDDAVNERPPVTPADLELHWNVDCRDTWNALQAQGNAGTCPLSEERVQQLRLCSHIHQPPGERDAGSCPNYRGALEQARSNRDCAAFKRFMRRQAPCPGN